MANFMRENAENLVFEYGREIIYTANMQSEKSFVQHGGVSCYEHSFLVACLSVRIAGSLKIKVDMRSLVRGALLHDYFLYDWHESGNRHENHALGHAAVAFENASRDFELNEIEGDIILKHMFPLNIRLPHYRESLIVSFADKLSCMQEMFLKKNGENRIS